MASKTLLDVLPIRAAHDAADGFTSNPEGTTERNHALSLCAPIADFPHRQLGEFRDMLPLAPSYTPLVSSISRIVCRRSKEKMFRAHAATHITDMTDEQSVGDFAVREFPCGTVGKMLGHMVAYLAVAAGVKRRHPKPTISALIDVRPKPLCEPRIGRRSLGRAEANLRTVTVGIPRPSGKGGLTNKASEHAVIVASLAQRRCYHRF